MRILLNFFLLFLFIKYDILGCVWWRVGWFDELVWGFFFFWVGLFGILVFGGVWIVGVFFLVGVLLVGVLIMVILLNRVGFMLLSVFVWLLWVLVVLVFFLLCDLGFLKFGLLFFFKWVWCLVMWSCFLRYLVGLGLLLSVIKFLIEGCW